ncbi:STAS/SEC14 domain-containing protein [Halofilum ochraceum]|uniref:STAS/SEC14 domain-containing protein n=1 Tax=Halofilum ochraceum TaxID=1611323 RepID=UPI0008DA974C|nr:STAS/SEC14 domain-containing protein [Halofilum ochraceum]
MLEPLEAPDHVLALRIAGKLTGRDVDRYSAMFHEKLERRGGLGACIDLSGFADLDAAGLVKGTAADLEFLAHIGRFRRVAIVSDKNWPHVLVALIERVVPDLPLCVFGAEQADEAMQWAAQQPAAASPRAPALRFMPTSHDDVLGFEINGVLTAAETPAIVSTFNEFLARHERVRVLNRMTGFRGIEVGALAKTGLLSMKLSALQEVERYAIVGAPAWMTALIARIDPLFPDMAIRSFAADAEEEAWQWLDARPEQGGTAG